jgi:pimeloyl-ACP methyl ester carboxylesterase
VVPLDLGRFLRARLRRRPPRPHARLIPEARYVELAGVGHIVPLDAGDRLAAVVEEA